MPRKITATKARTRAASKKQEEEGKVTYRHMESVQLYEVPSLDQFLASAFTNKWIVLLNVSKLPRSGPIEWCPSLQPRLLETGEIAKQIKNPQCLRNLIVVDLSNPFFREKIQEFVDAETAFVNMHNLIQEEDESAASVKKMKNNESATGGNNSREDTLEDVQMGIHQVTDAGKEKGHSMWDGGLADTNVQTTQEHVCIDEVTRVAKEKGDSKRRGEAADIEVKRQKDKLEDMEAKAHEERESPTRKFHNKQEDNLFPEEGRVMYKGKSFSGLEMLVQLLTEVETMKTSLKTEVETMKTSLKTELEDLTSHMWL